MNLCKRKLLSGGATIQLIYIDTLFLLNATVDYLLLLASARIAGEPLARCRFLLASTLGGLYAVGIFFLPFLENTGYKLLLGSLIMLIAYGKSQRLLRQTLIFLALSCAFAGGILAISLQGGQNLSLEGGVLYSTMDFKMVLLSASACYVVLSILFKNFGQHSKVTGELVTVKLQYQEKTISFPALVDTGNTLQDPVTGTPVLVVEGQILAPLFPPDFKQQDLQQPTTVLNYYKHQPISQRLRLIPYQAVGVQGLLLVLKVDQILVNDSKIDTQLLALSPTSVSDGGNYKALIGTKQTVQI